MEDALNSYLIQLLSCTPSIYRNDTEDRVNKAKDITFDILSITRKSQDESIIPILFDKTNGLTIFLPKLKAIPKKSLNCNTAIRNILDTFEELLKKFTSFSSDHLVMIKNAALMFISTKEAKIRQISYSILSQIVSLSAQSSLENPIECLDISSLSALLFSILAKPPDKSNTAKRSFLSLLGKLAQHFPSTLQEKASRIIKQILFDLEQEIKKYVDSDNIVVGGCIEALTGFLYSFHITIEEKEMKKLHDALLLIISRGLGFRTQYTPRVALDLLIEHVALFNRWLLKQYKTWFDSLKAYALLPKQDSSETGVRAFGKFIEQSILCLKDDLDVERKSTILEFFVRNTCEMLESDEMSKKLRNVCIKALGETTFSVSGTNAAYILEYLTKKTSFICVKNEATDIELLPVCMEALGLVLLRSNIPLDGEKMHYFQKIYVHLFFMYLDIGVGKKCGISAAVFLAGIKASIENPLDFSDFVNNVVVQSLIRSTRPELNSENIKNYGFLWITLMNFSRQPELSFSMEERASLCEVLDKQLVIALSTTVHRLNLTQNEFESSSETESATDLRTPHNPADWKIFHNLVELVEQVLKTVEPKERLIDLLIPFGKEINELSMNLPFVPGLYTVMSTTFHIIGEHIALKDRPLYELYMSSVIRRLPQLPDDLLVSAVQAVLSSPTWLVISVRNLICNALASSLKIGLTYTPIADWPLSALEHWQTSLPFAFISSLIEDIFPSLEPYLNNVEQPATELLFISNKRLSGPSAASPTQHDTWKAIQRRVIKLLGRMGPICSQLVKKIEENTISQFAVGWQISSHLEFGLALNDMKPIIQVDAFLPRILYLVQHAGELKTRLAASEFLHASVVFSIGTCSQRTEELRRRLSFTPLYSKIFPVIIRLAVGADEVIRELFHELLFQLIHWFSRPTFLGKDPTGKRTILEPEAALFFEQLMNSACSGSEKSLVRELASKCILEFFVWTIKQCSDTVLWDDPAIPDFIFQNVRSAATHSSPHHRLGATLIMNKLYRPLRDSDALASVFTLDLLAHFVVCLTLAEQDDLLLGTLYQSKQALYNLTRIVSHRREVFSVPNSKRRTAPLLLHGTSGELVEFLIERAFSSQQHCRQICFEICSVLSQPRSISEVTTEYLSKHPLAILLSNKLEFQARLDIYYWLIYNSAISTDICDTDPILASQFQVFIADTETLLKREAAVKDNSNNGEKTTVFLSWLKFLTKYLPVTQSSALVNVEILARAALQPTKLGFTVYATAFRNQFYSYVENIFPMLKQSNQTIVSVMNSADFQLNNEDWSDMNKLDVLRGLELIINSGCLDANKQYCIPPKQLLKIAVDNVMNDQSIIPSDNFLNTLKASNLLLELALSTGLQMEILVGEFTNPALLSGSTVTSGQFLRSKLGSAAIEIVFRYLKDLVPFLPKMGNGDPQQWILLLELLQVSHKASREFDEKKAMIVQSTLSAWSSLELHANTYGHTVNLRMVLESLMNIDVDQVRRNDSVKRWIINSWNHPSTEVSSACDFVPLLNVFTIDCSLAEEGNLISSLQQFFTNHFPSKTTALTTDSEKSAYFSLLNQMVRIVHVPVVLCFLVDLFALEPRHPSVQVFFQSVNSQDWSKITTNHPLERILNNLHGHVTTRTVNPVIRIDALEVLYIPLLTAAPPTIVERHLHSLLSGLIRTEEDMRNEADSLTQKMVFCALLTVAIVRVNTELLTGSLNVSYCNLKSAQPSDDGKDLLRFITRLVLKIRKITAPPNDSDLEIYQSMESGAFRLMQSVAAALSMDEDAVDKLVFKPLAPELWNAIIGTTKRYNLSVKVDRQRKMFLVHLPSSSQENLPVKDYISSQFLFGSTLSEDVYRFDFNQASISTTDLGTYEAKYESAPPTMIKPESSSLYLTLDELNMHPCMGPLVNFLRELLENKSNSTKSQPSEPKWMHTFRSVLLHTSVHPNVILFIVRLLLNLKSILKPYANFWYRPLLVALLRKIGGEPLNSLFREGLDMLLEWSKETPPPVDDAEFTSLASSLVQFLIKNINNTDREILRDNMEMFKAVFSVWNKVPLDVPHDIIEELLSSYTQNKTLKLGLQILDIIIVHGFLPTDHDYKPRFKECLVNILRLEEKREVNRSCAALCGSMLARESDTAFETAVYDSLQNWCSRRKNDVFVDLLYEVSIRHRPILSKFAITNLSLLGSLYGTLKAKCLEVLAISWQFMEDPWKEIGYGTIESILKGSNPAELCPILSLVKDLIPRVDISEWKPLWPSLVRLSRHQNVECRSRLYEIFKKALDLSDPVVPEFAQAILRACTDEDQELAIKMQNFLAEKLPSSTTDRLLTYITDFYSPDSEEVFVPYCSHFLLERATKHHVYLEPIFNEPLETIPFQVFDLTSLASQSSPYRQSRSALSKGFSYGTLQPGFLRATQTQRSVQFTPTHSTANWLMAETQTETKPSSHMKTPQDTTESISKEVFASPVKSWKRFTAEGPSSPSKLSYSSVTKSPRKTSDQPTIYRKYRKGELPDIQVPSSALIAPLQAVAMHDSLTAKTLFCQLVTAIRKYTKDIQGSDTEFSSKLNSGLEVILESVPPRQSSSNLVAAILEYFWTNDVELTMDIKKVVDIIKFNHIPSLGLLALEPSLPVPSVKDNFKKAKHTGKEVNSSAWFYAASLYRDLNNDDSVRAVVANLTNCNESTKKAIESESQNEWRKAFEFYSQTLGGEMPFPEEAEFCYEHRFKCLEELGQWEEINRSKPKTEPWRTRSRVRSALQNWISDYECQDLDRIPLISIDPTLLSDLAALALRNGNKDRAAVCTSKAIDELISRYSRLSPLNFGGRQYLLLQSSVVSELVTFMEQEGSTWNNSFPQTGDNLLTWERILTLRAFFAQLEKTKRINSFEGINSVRLSLATIALEQKNIHFARKLVEMTPDIPSKLPFRYLIQSKVSAMEAFTASESNLNKLNRFMLAKETVNLPPPNVLLEDEWKINRERFEAKLCTDVFKLLGRMQPKDWEENKGRIAELWGVQPNELVHKGLKHARLQTEIAENQANTSCLATAYFFLAKYCYEWRNVLSGEENHEMTRSILAAMRYGSLDGQSFFPLVILATKESSEAAIELEKSRFSVPLHMFLPWINQLVSHLASSRSIALVVADVAKQYPINVQVPYRISKSNLSPALPETDVIHLLETAIPINTTWEMFLRSLSYLYPPERAAKELLKSKNVVEEFSNFQSKYLNLPPPTASSAHGHVHYVFSQAFTTSFEEAFNHGNLDRLADSLVSFKKITVPGKRSLRDYSPWLANYRLGDNVKTQLEIPSSNGKSVKVESFRDDIQFLQSKQLPVRLILIVNGAIEYPVLVKFGEDVRQDERIIQLLHGIHVALMRDVESRKRSLRIHTFQVIPLTLTCGIFQWITDTTTLRAFLETNNDFHACLSNVQSEQKKIYPSAANPQYLIKTSQETLVRNYNRITEQVYRYGLQGAVKKLSQSPEAYFYLRNRLATTHGVLCSAHWILGVGDRHLSNFLISTKTGDIIGIDYGLAFGMATTQLPVPEVVPCRLTTQFQYLIPGLSLNGPIRESMLHTLRVAKADMGSILAALSIFVTEPTLNWLTHAEEMAKSSHNVINESTVWAPDVVVLRTENLLKGAHPSDVLINDLRQNKHFVSSEDQKVVTQLFAVIRGNRVINSENLSEIDSVKKRKSHVESYRTGLPPNGLSVEQQIQCLIEQSTDLACLCRMYWGWEPWI